MTRSRPDANSDPDISVTLLTLNEGSVPDTAYHKKVYSDHENGKCPRNRYCCGFVESGFLSCGLYSKIIQNLISVFCLFIKFVSLFSIMFCRKKYTRCMVMSGLNQNEIFCVTFVICLIMSILLHRVLPRYYYLTACV